MHHLITAQGALLARAGGANAELVHCSGLLQLAMLPDVANFFLFCKMNQVQSCRDKKVYQQGLSPGQQCL